MAVRSLALTALSAAAVAALAMAAAPARAQQDDVDPTRGVDAHYGALPRTATSTIGATTPVATPEQQRQARTLSMAIFARPAAAAKAAAKVDAANQKDLAPVRPKPEWADDKGGVGLGGKGLEIKAPF